MPGKERVASYFHSPRIEIIVVASEAADDIHTGPYELVMVLHLPDGKPPNTVKLQGGPYDRDGIAEAIAEVYRTIGQHHAPPELGLFLADKGVARTH